ncbi:transcription termination factor 3, mitochondrial [Ornithorhynchus anatinus]|nr:transcription termination factor 3, mitochondrial [Ornithorhynchus anatinus]XP_028917867.1 transcription termination factor 3, mitochondrial [Ornithorhynchus anatinus]
MALSARQIQRWFNVLKMSNVSTTQLGKQIGRWRMSLRELSAPLQLSSHHCVLRGQFKPYGTTSLRNSSQISSSNPQDTASGQSTCLPSIHEEPPKMKIIPNVDPVFSLEELEELPPPSPLDPVSEEEAVQIEAEPPLPPASFTLRDYVDRSETLQKLVHLGVELYKLEKRRDVGTLLLRLDFEKDIRKILLFLKDVGVEDDQVGKILTKNYAIFTEDIEDLKARVAYLKSKQFSKADIARMVTNAPFLLSFSVERLDNRLGFFQKELKLSVQKTRNLVIELPSLLTGSLEPVKENLIVYQVELGFKHNEIQHMITRIPRLLSARKGKLIENFDYVHNVMKIPQHYIVKFPEVFTTSLLKIKERHLFLSYLGRAQYNPDQPNYIPLGRLVSIPDEVFCEEVAKASLSDFEKFLKTL